MRRIYLLHHAGADAMVSYLEHVWGDTATRFRIAAENISEER